MRKIALFLIAFSSSAAAQDYQIVTSIAPIQGIVAEITEGRHVPVLLVPPGADPHEFALRPSQIRALQNADLIVLAGNGMEPWWDSVSGQISPQTLVLNLAALPQMAAFALPLRDNETLTDPHMWLSPDIARIWAAVIAEKLGTADPMAEDLYAQNLQALLRETDLAVLAAHETLAPVLPVQMVMGHDSLQYFEHAFGLQFGGAFSDGDGAEAGAMGVSEIAALSGPRCLVVDVNEAGAHGHAVLDDAPVVMVDPLGANLLGQPHFLGNLYTGLAMALAGCAPD